MRDAIGSDPERRISRGVVDRLCEWIAKVEAKAGLQLKGARDGPLVADPRRRRHATRVARRRVEQALVRRGLVGREVRGVQVRVVAEDRLAREVVVLALVHAELATNLDLVLPAGWKP